MKKIHPLIGGAIAATLLIAGAVSSTAENTKRRRVKVDPAGIAPAVATVAKTDTIAAPSDNAVSRSGYDKPLRSNKETFFLTNNLDATVEAVLITLDYLDRRGRELHSVTRWVECTLPPGATRQVVMRSWDRQQSFYYIKSHCPRRTVATPYSVSTRLDSIVIAR